MWKVELKTMAEIKTKGRLSVSYEALASSRCFQTWFAEMHKVVHE